MKDQSRNNAFRANSLLVVLVAAMFITTVTRTATAKSLYLIPDISKDPALIQIYDIAADGTLTFNAEFKIPHHMLGAVGLAIDSDSGYLFVTYEASETIEVIDATIMKGVGEAIVPEASNLAGIVYDHDKGLLYCAERDWSLLNIFEWDPNTATLTYTYGSPILLGIEVTAYGIALDEIHDLLYVANGSKIISVFNTSNWQRTRTISVSRDAVSIAVDSLNGFVYTGGGYADNYYLTQYHLATDTEKEVQVEPDAGVMGLAVNPSSGFVYMTTGRNNEPGGDNLLVYNKSLNLIDKVHIGGNPTGLVIPGRDVSFGPLNLSKDVVEGVIDEAVPGKFKSVGIGRTITYDICFDNINNDYDVTNVSLVDTLPSDVNFISADGDGVFGKYDPNLHTYTWSYFSLPPGTATCLKLVAQVNQDTEPNTVITNFVTMYTNEIPPITKSIDVITASIPWEAKLTFTPDVIRRDSTLETILATLELEGISRDQIEDQPLILNPGSIQSLRHQIYGTDSRVKILALFDKNTLVNTLNSYGRFKLTVTGKLTTGEFFVGEAYVQITRFTGN